MKNVFTLACILFLALGTSAQEIPLSGQVTVQNSLYRNGKLEYVRGAYVVAPFAKPVLSDEVGRFELMFATLAGNTGVNVTCEHSDLEVVNTKDLEHVTISQDRPIQITMAKKGHLAVAQTEFYNISKQALYAQKNALILRLQGSLEDQQAAIAEMERDFGQKIADRFFAEEILEKKVKEIEKRLPEVAQEMAAKNLDFASELYRQAYELFLEGKVVEAIKVLDDELLEESYRTAVKFRDQGKVMVDAGNDMLAKAARTEDQVLESYQTKGDWLELSLKYWEAARCYERVLEIVNASEEGKNPMDLAAIHQTLGKLYHSGGQYVASIHHFRLNLILVERSSPIDSIRLSLCYNYLALPLVAIGKYNEAKEETEKAIAVQEEILSTDHPELAVSYNNLASLFRNVKEPQKALELQQKAIAILEKTTDTLVYLLAVCYNNLSLIYQDLKDPGSALRAQRKSISLRKKALPLNHPDIGTSLHNLSTIHFSNHQPDSAIYYEELAIGILQGVFPSGHPTLEKIRNNMAYYYDEAGRKCVSSGNFSSGIIAFECALSYDPQSARALSGICFCKYSLGDYQGAIESCTKAYQLDSSIRLSTLHNIGMAHLKLGAFTQARAQFELLQSYYPQNFRVYQCWALYYALNQDAEASLDNLAKAIQLGLPDLNWIQTVEAFDKLRDHPRYIALIKSLKEKSK